MRSNLILTAVFALACGAASIGTAPAQTAQKLAVIDMQKALLSTKDGQKAVEDLRAKFSPREQEFQKRQADLKAKQEQYRKTENTISDEAKATLARDIDSMTKTLQRDTDDARQDVEQEQQRVLNELGERMMQVLTKYSAEKALTMVFDLSGQPNNVLFASSSVDITNDIIKMYDAAPPAISSAAPAPAPRRPAAPAPK
ncbi:MAG: OmpH family outer membrane protein [Acidobacteriota bacterium]|nr:OmpH family outer membrane protein [Acidobacteriota bacterium]